MTDQEKQEPEEEAAPEEGAEETPAEAAAEAAPETGEPAPETPGEGTPGEQAPGEEARAEAPKEGGPPTYEELESEIAALKDQLLRTLAESENVRRRAERDKADFAKYAVTGFAREILGVADNLRRALESVDAEARAADEALNSLAEGIEMTERALAAAFEQAGITPIEAIGRKFDHNFHQAMFELEDPDQPAGMVVQEAAKGYMLHDRLLRPAMVGVSKGGPKIEEPEAPAEEAGGAPKRKPSAYEKANDAVEKEEGDKPGVDKEL